jgi:hypothetical protein
MRAYAFLVTMASLLAGCAQQPVMSPKDDPIVKNLLGQPQNIVEEKLGLPNKRKDMETGTSVWTYIDKEKGINAHHCEVKVSIRNGTIEHVDILTSYSSLFSLGFESCDHIRKKLI